VNRPAGIVNILLAHGVEINEKKKDFTEAAAGEAVEEKRERLQISSNKIQSPCEVVIFSSENNLRGDDSAG